MTDPLTAAITGLKNSDTRLRRVRGYIDLIGKTDGDPLKEEVKRIAEGEMKYLERKDFSKESVTFRRLLQAIEVAVNYDRVLEKLRAHKDAADVYTTILLSMAAHKEAESREEVKTLYRSFMEERKGKRERGGREEEGALYQEIMSV